MIPVGRLGDIGVGTCYCHRSPTPYVTTLISGSANVLTNMLPTAQIGSIGVGSCGHMTIALTGSFNATANVLPVHRIGDSGQGCSGTYTLISGSSNVLA